MTGFLSWNTTKFCFNVVFNFLQLMWIVFLNLSQSFPPQSMSYESDINTLSGHLLGNFVCGMWRFPTLFLLLYVPWRTLSGLIKRNWWNLLLLQKNTNLQTFAQYLIRLQNIQLCMESSWTAEIFRNLHPNSGSWHSYASCKNNTSMRSIILLATNYWNHETPCNMTSSFPVRQKDILFSCNCVWP